MEERQLPAGRSGSPEPAAHLVDDAGGVLVVQRPRGQEHVLEVEDAGFRLAERCRPIHGLRGLAQLVLPFQKAGDDDGHRLGGVETGKPGLVGTVTREWQCRSSSRESPPRSGPNTIARRRGARATTSSLAWGGVSTRRSSRERGEVVASTRLASRTASPSVATVVTRTTSCPPIAMRMRSSSSSTGNAGCTSISSPAPKFPATRIAAPTFPGYRDRTSTTRISTEGL